jgi:dolichol-phosphate mannosyltransferase
MIQTQLLSSCLNRCGARDHLPKFLTVGLVGIAVDCLCFYLILHFFTPEVLIAQVFSFLLALTHNFLLNKYWTFKENESTRAFNQYCKFFIVACLALGLRSGVIAQALVFGFSPFISLMAGIGSGTAVNFIGSREWAFADKAHSVVPGNRTYLIWAFICFLIVLRVVYASLIELAPEEAYYWNYSLHPALSYFDHPPMVAWVIWLGTTLLGKNELGVRIIGLVLNLLSTTLVYLLGKMWFGRKPGLVAALLFQLIPLYFIYGFTITPDLPLFFFWLSTLYFLTKAVQQEKRWPWYAAGISAGSAMLSKYTGVFLFPSALLFLLLVPPYRCWLRRKEPYLAAVISFLVFSPVIIWNYQHEWASFGFQFGQRFSEPATNPVVTFLTFLGSQFGVLFPPFALAVVGVFFLAGRQSMRKERRKWRFAFCFSFPLLALFTLYSLKGEVKVNWPLPAYLSLLIALYPGYRAFRLRSRERVRHRVRRLATGSVYVLPIILIVFLYHLAIGIPFMPTMSKLGGWEQLSKAVDKEETAMEQETGREPFLIGLSKYYISAELSFYTDDPHDTFSLDLLGGKSLGFKYWTDKEALRNRDAVVIGHQSPNLDFLKNFFARVDTKVTRIDIVKQGVVTDAYYVVRCYGFLG